MHFRTMVMPTLKELWKEYVFPGNAQFGVSYFFFIIVVRDEVDRHCVATVDQQPY